MVYCVNIKEGNGTFQWGAAYLKKKTLSGTWKNDAT